MKQNVTEFIRNSAGEYERIEKLAGDASIRKYFRIHTNKNSSVLCIDSNFIDTPTDRYPFFIVHKILASKNITVPKIYSIDEKNGLLLLQDGGDDHLCSVCPDLNHDRKTTLFKELIDIIVEIQFIEGDEKQIPFCLSFDMNKLMFEFDFFIEHALLKYFNAKISNAELEKLRREFIKISEILYHPETFVLNHRDFHSRNVLIFQSKPFILDFQDARMGLPLYDVVSLLRDSYHVLDEILVKILKEYHFHQLGEKGYHKMTQDKYEYFFDIMAFQRNIKAIGTFGYQITSLGNTIYENYIVPTLNYLPDYTERRKELRAAGEILQKYLEADW